ncbi:hypothetical protein [Streptomyces sp. AC495_CC817]|uniref:hypothetical protein n=1 Tax=Streptomyces sp. AC495_CC817 TaxID=2823900 RepID=UPI001C26ADE9|nr:hypothetical protein [Streptomyces sp. AC495_CC817]
MTDSDQESGETFEHGRRAGAADEVAVLHRNRHLSGSAPPDPYNQTPASIV